MELTSGNCWRSSKCSARVGHNWKDVFVVKTDHHAVKWLQDQPNLSRRQAGWIEKLQAYDMQIEYLPGKMNTVPDILSRRPDHMPNCPKCNAKVPLSVNNIDSPLMLDQIRHFLESDVFASNTIDRLRKGGKVGLSELRDDLLFYNNRLYIQAGNELRLELVKTAHDAIHWQTEDASLVDKILFLAQDGKRRT